MSAVITADSTLLTADSGLLTVDGGQACTFSPDQYSQAARNLLPRGRAWNRQDGSNQALFCDALGLIYAQQDADCLQMLKDFFPATAGEGLTEWNASLGLPDPCLGTPSNQTTNQQQIVAKLIATGGQSVAYYIELAAAIGFDITITEFSPSNPGTDAPLGLIVHPQDWAYTWRVNILNEDTAPNSSQLVCLLDRYKPAHTQFYIAGGSVPVVTTRLFNVTDNAAQPLLIASD